MTAKSKDFCIICKKEITDSTDKEFCAKCEAMLDGKSVEKRTNITAFIPDLSPEEQAQYRIKAEAKAKIEAEEAKKRKQKKDKQTKGIMSYT